MKDLKELYSHIYLFICTGANQEAYHICRMSLSITNRNNRRRSNPLPVPFPARTNH